MAEASLKLGGDWATKEGSLLGFNDQNGNYKPIPFDFTRATTATRVNRDGLIEEVQEGVPRIDFSSGDGSLLLEPQRTNSITYSEDFSNGSWIKSGDVTLTSNYGISPEGYQNADRIVANATAGGHIVYRNISTTGTHTISIFAKASGYNYIFFGYDGGSLNFGIVFNLSNGTISQNPAGLNGDIEAIGSDGWYRCSLTFNYSTTGYFFVVSPHDNSGAYVWTGNGTDGILIYGAQIEYNSSYPTSYIKTSGSAVTRNADVCNNAQTTFNDSEGVLYAEIVALADDLTNRDIAISDGTGNNRVFIYYSTTSNQIVGRVRVSNADVALLTYTLTDITNYTKIALKYKANDFALWIDGIERATDTSGGVFGANTLTTLAFDAGEGSNDFYGNCKEVRVYNTALTDTELQELTTI